MNGYWWRAWALISAAVGVLSLPACGFAQSQIAETGNVVVKVSAAKVFSGATPIAEIRQGDRLAFSQRNGEWYLVEVRRDGTLQNGWIHRDDVDVENAGGSREIDGWGQITDPIGDCAIQEVKGRVIITVPTGLHDLWKGQKDETRRFNAPRLMREVEGDFVVRVQVTTDSQPGVGQSDIPALQKLTGIDGSHPYQGLGLLIWDSDEHFLRLERNAIIHAQGVSLTVPWYVQNGTRANDVKLSTVPLFQGSSTWLQLERSGQKVVTSISHDGESWINMGELTTEFPSKVLVGIAAVNVSNQELVAGFGDLKLTTSRPEADLGPRNTGGTRNASGGAGEVLIPSSSSDESPSTGLTEAGVLQGHQNSAFMVAAAPDGRRALSTGVDGTLRTWDLTTGMELGRIQAHENWAVGLALSPDGKRAATSGNDMTIRLWDLATGQELRRFTGHSMYVWSLMFSSDGRQLLSGSHDGTVRLWNVETGDEQRRFEVGDREVWSASISPDGKRILTADLSGAVRLWDASTGQPVWTRQAHTSAVTVAFSPDGSQALSGGKDGLVLCWDLDGGSQLRQLAGHENTVRVIAFSPNGKQAATTGYDQTVRLWNVDSGRQLARYDWPSDKPLLLFGVAFARDGKQIIAAGSDGMVRVLEISDIGLANDDVAVHQAGISALQNDASGQRPAMDWSRKATIGAMVRDVTERDALRAGLSERKGVVVTAVLPDSPALQSGLRSGDVILEMGDEPTIDLQAFVEAIGASTPGDRLTLNIGRETGRFDLDLILDERPGDEAYFALMLQGAEQGDLELMNLVARGYYLGQQVQQNDVEAARWFLRAAEKGHAESQRTLGLMYTSGRGGTNDDVEGVRWLRQAADQGDLQAQVHLGVCYRTGRGVPEDFAEAVKWFRKSAEQGFATAQNELGTMYATGRGVPRDDAAGLHWFQLAAAQGHADAENNVGVIWENGFGVTPDRTKAIEHYRKAAGLGSEKAREKLLQLGIQL